MRSRQYAARVTKPFQPLKGVEDRRLNDAAVMVRGGIGAGICQKSPTHWLTRAPSPQCDKLSRKKRSHQVIENKDPEEEVGLKRSHQVIENKGCYEKTGGQIRDILQHFLIKSSMKERLFAKIQSKIA
jgi:hypothetical protein